MVFRLGAYCLCGRGVARFFEAEPTEFCVVNRVNRSICSDGLGAVQRGWILALGLAMPHANNVIDVGGAGLALIQLDRRRQREPFLVVMNRESFRMVFEEAAVGGSARNLNGSPT